MKNDIQKDVSNTMLTTYNIDIKLIKPTLSKRFILVYNNKKCFLKLLIIKI